MNQNAERYSLHSLALTDKTQQDISNDKYHHVTHAELMHFIYADAINRRENGDEHSRLVLTHIIILLVFS